MTRLENLRLLPPRAKRELAAWHVRRAYQLCVLIESVVAGEFNWQFVERYIHITRNGYLDIAKPPDPHPGNLPRKRWEGPYWILCSECFDYEIVGVLEWCVKAGVMERSLADEWLQNRGNPKAWHQSWQRVPDWTLYDDDCYLLCLGDPHVGGFVPTMRGTLTRERPFQEWLAEYYGCIQPQIDLGDGVMTPYLDEGQFRLARADEF